MHVLMEWSSISSDHKMGESILPTVLEMVGNTPMVRLDRIAKMEGLECELCECVETINL